MNQPLYLDRVVPFSCAIAYFVLLEALPLGESCVRVMRTRLLQRVRRNTIHVPTPPPTSPILVVVLVFYRRMPLPSRELLPEEGKLLGSQPFSYQHGTMAVDMGMGGGPGGGWSIPDPSRSTLSVEER